MTHRPVVFVSATGVMGGAEVNLLRMMAGLAAGGREVSALVPRHSDLAAALSRAGLTAAYWPPPLDRLVTRPPGGNRARRALGRLAALMARPAASAAVRGQAARSGAVVHLNSARAVFIAGDGPGTVAEVKDALVHPFFSEPMARLIAARYRRACQVAVPNSEFVARSLVSAGFPSERAVTVYNGLDLSSVKPLSGAERRAVRSTFNLGPSDHVVTMVGRLARWKGQDIALEAFAAYRQDSRDSHLLLLGDEAFDGRGFAAELRALTARLGISERVVFGGFVEDAWRVIGASDVALHCSRLPEPLGLTPVESQATAVPVVASAEGGVLETVEDRVTGYLFAPRDPQAAAEGLRWVDTVDAEQVGGAGRLRAEQMFDIHRTVAAYERLYEAL